MTVKKLLSAILPNPVLRWLKNQRWRVRRLLVLRKRPLDPNWGWGRGRPVDRYYIENFLAGNSRDVRGHVLEFGDDHYARLFGGGQVAQVDVHNLTADGPQTTQVGDLASADHIPSAAYDCIVCTQVLPFVYDVRGAVRTLYRILKPEGVMLLTAPCIGKLDREEVGGWKEYWRFTAMSLRRLFEEVFPPSQVEVRAFGNLLVANAFLHGFAVEDLRPKDLEPFDPNYEVTITLRAVKPKIAPPTS